MSFAFKSADILLPKKDADHKKWSVVACDQYTSEPEYWAEVKEIVGDAPSTYNLILPEVYLNNPDVEERLDGIKDYMNDYLNQEIFDEYKDAMVYVRRTDSTGKVREGIVGAIDLEEYDYTKGSTSLVRATEATVIERIPPRVKVRKSAEIELPHIMILIDDPAKTVVEPLAGKSLETIYDFDMMQGGGHLKGALIDADSQAEIINAMKKLGDPEHFNNYYGLTDTPVLLFAMGDGNHSLATAKAFYEQLKADNPDKDMSNHPARYALVEIVNLHSEALEFEAIHRIVSGVRLDKLVHEMSNELWICKADECKKEYTQYFDMVCQGIRTRYAILKPNSKLSVGSLQNFLDDFLAKNGGEIDYIHGEDVAIKLANKQSSAAFILPDMHKDELFPTVIADGALPRKTFSMGHAQDKRFYMECRKIR